MQNENFLEKIAAGFSQTATVKNVFGEPIQAGEKTIIPVAKIAYGYGGGFGQGNRGSGEQKPAEGGSGGGAGGGLRAVANGVYEITPAATRFIPATPYKYVFGGIVAGFLLSVFLKGRKWK